MLSERNKTQKPTYCMIAFLWKKQIYMDGNQSCVCQGRGMELTTKMQKESFGGNCGDGYMIVYTCQSPLNCILLKSEITVYKLYHHHKAF